jgi:hypothetical protein
MMADEGRIFNLIIDENQSMIGKLCDENGKVIQEVNLYSPELQYNEDCL